MKLLPTCFPHHATTVLALSCWLLASACAIITPIDAGGTRASLPPTAVHSVTAGLDASGEPANQSRAILLPGKVYLHSAWFNLPERELAATISLLNPAGETVHSAESTFAPVHGRWISYAWYTFGAEDMPGVWRFEITLDGSPTSSREFLVRASHGVINPLTGSH